MRVRRAMVGVAFSMLSACAQQPVDPCTMNPCTSSGRTACVAVNGRAECRCEAGFAPEGDGCSSTPTWTCAQQHVAGDGSEPDECPPLARKLPSDLQDPHTIEPAGDQDWYELRVTANRIVQFKATSAATQLLIDVFEGDGVTKVASDIRAAPAAEVLFLAPYTGAVTVRVRALRVSDTGSYEATYRELGVDDFANDVADAVTLTAASGAFSGSVQYAGDLDVVRLDVPARTAISLSRSDAGPGLELDVSSADGRLRTLQARERTTVSFLEPQSLVVTARGLNDIVVGPFSIALSDLGPDDYSDDPRFARELALDGRPVAVLHERPGDVDSFWIPQVEGRIYRAAWSDGSILRAATLERDDGSTVVAGASTTGFTWIAASDRTAALRLSTSSSAGGARSFDLMVSELGPDDHDEARPSAVVIGASVPGRLELRDDVDAFSFTATAGQIVVAAAVPTGGSNENVRVRLFSPTRQLLATGNAAARSPIGTSGTYTVHVDRSGSTALFDLLSYELTVSNEGPDDHPNGSPGSTALAIDTPADGVFQYAGDIDSFAFQPQVNHLYRAECSRAQGGCTLRVRDPLGQLVSETSNTLPRDFFVETAGTWTLEVLDRPTPFTLGPFTATIVDRGPEDHDAVPANATLISVGSPETGTFGFPNDVDAFSFPAVAGRIYRAELSTTDSSFLARVELRDAGGSLIASDTARNAAAALAPSGGPLTLLVSSVYGVVRPYSVLVTDDGTDDHANQASSGTPLANGATTAAAIQYAGDADWFRVPVVARRHHRVLCTTVSGAPCTLRVETGGAVLAIANPNATPTTEARFTPPVGVTEVEVRVAAAGTSAYQVLAEELSDDDHGDVFTDATPLTLRAAPTVGELAIPYDVDVFTMAAPLGSIVSFTCTRTSGNACAVSVFDDGSGASPILTRQASAQFTSAFLSQGTPARIEVRASGTAIGAYSISVAPGVDDVVTAETISVGTPRMGSIDYVGDSDDFEVSLTAGTTATFNLSAYFIGDLSSPNGSPGASILGGASRTYTPYVSGVFRIQIRSDSGGMPTGPYTLTVQ